MIALLCSVQAEAESLLERMNPRETAMLGSKSMIEGTLAGHRVVLCIAGMGKVNAAHAATLLITRYETRALIVFGVGGAYAGAGAAVGDIALASEEIAGDEGVLTADGFKDTEYIGIPLLKTATSGIYNTYPVPQSLLLRAQAALASHPLPGNLHVGPFVTLSTCTGTAERARELEARYRGLCENMEGAAAAHVALCHGVPWLEVRGISNLVEERNLATWDIPKAARSAHYALNRILEAWEP